MADLSKLPELNSDDYKPLYVQLSEILIAFIRENGLVEGDPVPSENELLKKLEVSRTTIRQAYQNLENQDIIRRIRGKGTFVASPKKRDSVKQFQTIEDMLAEQGVQASNRVLEMGEIFMSPDCAKALERPEGSTCLHLRRVKLANNKPYALEERYLPMEIAKLFSMNDFENKSLNELMDSRKETREVRVRYRIRNFPLTPREAEALEVDEHALVIRRGGIYYNAANQPVMAGRVTFLADRVELTYEFHRDEHNWGVITLG